MSANRARTRLAWIAAGSLAVALVVAGILIRRAGTIAPSSPEYEELTRAFYHGLAALEVGLLDDARAQFTRATEIVPREPAAWANLGLTQLRLGDVDPAAQAIDRAAALAPSSSAVAFLQGQLETSRGRPEEAIARFRRAVELDPRGLRVRYALEQEIESAGGPDADAQAQQLFDEVLALAPDNLAALLERGRVAAKRRDTTRLQDSVARLEPHSGLWPAIAVEQYRTLQRAAAQPDFAEAGRTLPVLRNVLLRLPAFREDLVALRTPGEIIAEPFDRFLALAASTSRPSPPDAALAFSNEAIGANGAGPWSVVAVVPPDGTGAPAVLAANARTLDQMNGGGAIVPFPAGQNATPPSAHGVLALDWNRDFRMDLVLAGAGGLRLLVQQADGTYRDETAAAWAGAAAITADCSGAWTADIEMDGDLDVIVGITGAPPQVLRNNGDGSWRRIEPFPGISGVQAFAWGDVDGDGDPDAALLDAAGSLRLFENRQGGQFEPMAGPAASGGLVAVAIGDVNGDGALDLVTLDASGTIRRASRQDDGWDQQTLAAWAKPPVGSTPGTARIFIEDLDNNGSPDLTISGGGRSRIWLSNENAAFSPLEGAPDAEIFAVVDLNGDGQLDLLGLADGRAIRWLGHGTKGYHWQVFRPRAQTMAGDQRINSFGIGGHVGIRSGLLRETRVISSPAVHFGLGTRTAIDVVRIVWPNGVAQADFNSAGDGIVVAEQRLKGSCPWVFTDDGAGMRFVTDFLWRSPLGLRINAQDTAGVSQTEDWVKIRADQLVPRNGSYDVRITAELWETHFVDHVSLMTVDHPADLDVFVDERFARESPALQAHAMSRPQPLAHAADEAGRDVTDLLQHQDGRYLATFARGVYQGVASDHFVELDLDAELLPAHPRWLVANGWIYPTDSSINVAIGQGRQDPPRGLSLEAQAPSGTWVVVSADLGFPAGKNKTILIDLTTVARAGVPHARRLRLRTNLEIYWDWIATAERASSATVRTTRIAAGRADLRYRGFSKTDYRRDAPEVPRYGELANIVPRWRDLVGYYTRFGDVRALLAGVDDRYVIMNAGDELQLAFPAPEPPPTGWTRDFVLVGDGWVKDGDFNTSYSKTVLPLPTHERADYVAASPSLDLEDDPVYRRHAEDWQTYHTRFVTPRAFLGGLDDR